MLLALAGLTLAGWGTLAAFQSPRRRAIAGTLAAPVGVIAILLGVVLAIVPGFLSR